MSTQSRCFALGMVYITCHLLEKGIICDSSILWESIYYLGYSRKYVSVVHLVLEILFNYEFLLYHVYLDNYILYSTNEIIEVKLFEVHANLSQFDVKYDAVYIQINCGQI